MGILEDLTRSSQSQTSGIRVAPETALEQFANPMLQRQLSGMEGLVGAGAGQADVTAGAQGMRDYAAQLGQYSTAAGLFGAQQAGVDQYTKLGEMIFGGQMRQQQQEAQRLAGRLGRPVNDPILQAKLAQQRSDTVGSFAAQQAMQLPFQLAQFGGQRAEALQGLASQAMANRQALLGLGSQLREQDRAYRINTGERYSNQSQTGSMMDLIGGFVGMAGTGLGAYSQLSNASNYGKLVDQQLAKGGGGGGLLGGATGGLGDKMAGTLGIGGGGSQAPGYLGGAGMLLSGGAQAARALAPRTAPTAMSQPYMAGGAGATNYMNPVGQDLLGADGKPVFANPGPAQNMFSPAQGSPLTYRNPLFY